MLVNDLASVLRNYGCTVQEAAGWTTHNVGQLTAVQTIVIHHTATSAASPGDYPSYNIIRGGRSDLAGPLAQLGVGRAGTVYVFSSGQANHAGVVLSSSYNNAHSIGIEVESPGTGLAWTNEQLHATARAAAALCKKFGLSVSRVLGHKEVCSPVGRKIDPVGIPGDMAAFRQLVQQYINDPSYGEDMPLTGADTNAVWMQKCTMVYADGTTETHPAATWLTVAAARISGLVGSVAALSAAVEALSNDADITSDEMKAIVREAVEQNIKITGTVTVEGD